MRKFEMRFRLIKRTIIVLSAVILLYSVSKFLPLLVSHENKGAVLIYLLETFANYLPIVVFLLAIIPILESIFIYLDRNKTNFPNKQIRPKSRINDESNIDDKTKKNKDKKRHFSDFLHVYEFYEDMSERLKIEINNLTQRSNLNLAIGLVTSLAGLIILGIINFIKSPDHSGLTDFFTYYSPKLSLIIIIEIFGYFFLRLYKNSLEEIRYYHNELTNIENKILSIFLIMEHNNATSIEKLSLELSKTERNRIFNKNQTTVELEMLKSENQNLISIKDLLSKLITKKLT